jgi:hypothetical protein
MVRCTKEEEEQIFHFIKTDTYHVMIDKEQALEVARILKEEVNMDMLNRLLKYNDKINLNSWINGFRFKNTGLAQLASSIAANTRQTAITDEDRARGERETNAAAALTRGDIDGAFRSLNYFLDR